VRSTMAGVGFPRGLALASGRYLVQSSPNPPAEPVLALGGASPSRDESHWVGEIAVGQNGGLSDRPLHPRRSSPSWRLPGEWQRLRRRRCGAARCECSEHWLAAMGSRPRDKGDGPREKCRRERRVAREKSGQDRRCRSCPLFKSWGFRCIGRQAGRGNPLAASGTA